MFPMGLACLQWDLYDSGGTSMSPEGVKIVHIFSGDQLIIFLVVQCYTGL